MLMVLGWGVARSEGQASDRPSGQPTTPQPQKVDDDGERDGEPISFLRRRNPRRSSPTKHRLASEVLRLMGHGPNHPFAWRMPFSTVPVPNKRTMKLDQFTSTEKKTLMRYRSRKVPRVTQP
jgi:hypothetical protein